MKLPITTARLELRVLTPSDIPALFKCLQTREVTRSIPLPEPYLRRDARAFVDRAGRAFRSGKGLYLAITKEADGGFLGMVGLDQIDWTARRGHLGYWLGRPYWGNGYASEASAAVCSMAFGPLQLHRVETTVYRFNRRSARVLRRLGFRLEGRGRERGSVDREWVDDLYYGLIAAEWAARKDAIP